MASSPGDTLPEGLNYVPIPTGDGIADVVKKGDVTGWHVVFTGWATAPDEPVNPLYPEGARKGAGWSPEKLAAHAGEITSLLMNGTRKAASRTTKSATAQAHEQLIADGKATEISYLQLDEVSAVDDGANKTQAGDPAVGLGWVDTEKATGMFRRANPRPSLGGLLWT